MYRYQSVISREEYDAFVANHPLNALLQSYDWGAVKQAWQAHHVGVYAGADTSASDEAKKGHASNDTSEPSQSSQAREKGPASDHKERLVATALILVRQVAPGMRFGYIPRGPIMDYTQEDLVKFMLTSLRKFAHQHGLMFIKFDPKCVLRSAKLKDHAGTPTTVEGELAIANLLRAGAKHKGYTKAIADTFQPRYDATLYLVEEVEAHFPPNTRKMARRARNKNVQIEWGDASDCQRLVDVLQKTMDRQRIALRNTAYFEHLCRVFGDRVNLAFATLDVTATREHLATEIAEIDRNLERLRQGNSPKKLVIVEGERQAIVKSLDELNAIPDLHEGKVTVSGMITIGYGDTYEMLYAGFDERFSTYYPQYLLYAEMMEKAQKEGYRKACMGGVEGSFDDGLTRFKLNFAPQFEEYIGEFDLITSPKYYIFYALLRLRSRLRKLR